MKNTSFLVALLAMLQFVIGVQQSKAQERPSERPSLEEALDRASREFGREFEGILREFEHSGDDLEKSLEKWVEQNADQLEAWQEKYGDQWNRWGEKFGRKLESMSQRQQFVWEEWARSYEQDLNSWANRLNQDIGSMDSDDVGELVERNLKMLSKMPLGQLVDDALDSGVGELADAPWDSLGELGELAQQALAQSTGDFVDEVTEIVDPDNQRARNVGEHGRRMIRSLDQLKQDVQRSVSDDLVDDRSKASASDRLEDMLDRADLSRADRERLMNALDTIRDAEKARGERRTIERRMDPVKDRVKREKEIQERSLSEFNQDLRKSSEQSRRDDRARMLENRKPKRVDGKNQDGNPESQANSKKELIKWFRDGRDSRSQSSGKATRSSDQTKGIDQPAAKETKTESGETLTELQILKKELEALRNEIKQLKKDK